MTARQDLGSNHGININHGLVGGSGDGEYINVSFVEIPTTFIEHILLEDMST